MGGEDGDKIIRDSGDTLTIKVTGEEETYRAKYLPDPKKLTDEKLVCTVCSVSLAREIHQGKTIHVHRALKVLVCEACFTFYGDGCFSTDEDGDDKYCRWCGQGGSLFLCATCNCAFCQKCVKQNLKASVLADLERDDWKCYFCNPRPLFGCRTICWGALELNKIGIEKEKEKLKKQRERLAKMEARKREREEQLHKLKKLDMSSEDEQSTKKRKSRMNNSDSSSPEVMPAKKSRSLEGRGHVNGSIDRSRRKRKDSSSSDDDDDDSDKKKRITSKLRSRTKRTKKQPDSSSEDESDVKSKSKVKLKKKTSKDSSDSSNEDKKSKRKSEKKKKESSDDESSDEKYARKKKLSRRKKSDSESESDNKPKRKSLRKKKKDSSDEEKSSGDHSKKHKKVVKKKNQAEDSSDDSDNNSKRDRKKLSESKKRNDESDCDSKKGRKNAHDKCVVDGKTEEIKLKVNDNSGDDALVRKRIKLAVLWLSNAVKDISELGTLISIRATKFGKKKINQENLKTYDDVLNAVSKLKQLMSGIHSNYEHLEKGLEAQLKPWKILTGLEEPDKEKGVVEETNTTVKSEEAVKEVTTSEICDKTTVETVKVKSTSEQAETSNENGDMVLQWSGLSADEDSNEELMATKALISKANDTLEKEVRMNGETETIENDVSTTKEMKNNANTTDEVSVTDPKTPTKNSTIIKDGDNSESLLDQSENDIKDDAQTLMENSGEEMKKQEQDRSNISQESNTSHAGSDTDMFDNNEVFSSTQVINEEGGNCSENESEKEERKDSSGSASKRKSQ